MTSAQHNYLLMRLSLEQFGNAYSELNSEQQAEAQQLAGRALSLQQAVLASPEAAAVSVPDAELQHAILQLADRFDSNEAYHKALAANQLSEAGLAEALKAELATEATLAHVACSVPELSDEEAKTYYEQQLAKFEQPERRYASHILLTINPDFAENTQEESHRRICELAEQATPEGFAALAKRHSECPSAMNDGELGWVESGLLFPELEAQLFNMAVGEISPPIETEVGYHILYCQQIKPPHRVPFEQASDKIKESHRARRQTRFQKQWVQQLIQAQLCTAS